MSPSTATTGVCNANLMTAVSYRRRSSAQSNTSTTLALPSPSIMAARAYFLEQLTPIMPFDDALQWRKSLTEGHPFPRRHSVLATPGLLATQLENFSFDSGSEGLTAVAEADGVHPRIKVEDGVENFKVEDRDDSSTLSISPRKSVTLSNDPAEILRQVPFEYTHGHLREWGYAYLGNQTTADAFVNAVNLRRPSIALMKADGSDLPKAPSLVTIRARVLPKSKERKPFLIQRQLNIEELRSTISSNPKLDEVSGIQKPSRLRRSSRPHRSSAQHESVRRSIVEHQRGDISPSLRKRAIPIHIEYALHYLPVLAALMLSGYIRKGDSIDLPIPHPEAWQSVISYIYTGKVTMTAAIQENIFYLAGNTA